MNNLKSYTEYAVTTPTTDFVIGFDFNYGTDAVNVTVDDVPATEAGYSVIYLNSTTMRLNPAVPTGVVRLQRETDIDVPDNQFTAGAKFIASNMDENFTQIRHSQQEVRDGFNKLSDDTYEIIDTLQVVGQAAQDAADAAEQAAQTANDAASQVNDKVSYTDLNDAIAATPHNNMIGRDVAEAHPASAILDVSGESQQWINNKVTINVNSVAELRAVEVLKDGQLYAVESYREYTGYGGGLFRYDSTSVETVDNGTVFQHNTEIGRFIRVNTNLLTVEDFGADPTYTLDSTAAIQNFLNKYGDFRCLDGGKYKITSQLNRTGFFTAHSKAEIVFDFNNTTAFLIEAAGGEVDLGSLTFNGASDLGKIHRTLVRVNETSGVFGDKHKFINHHYESDTISLYLWNYGDSKLLNGTYKNITGIANGIIGDSIGPVRAVYGSGDRDCGALVIKGGVAENINNVDSSGNTVWEDADAFVVQLPHRGDLIVKGVAYKNIGKRLVKSNANAFSITKVSDCTGSSAWTSANPTDPQNIGMYSIASAYAGVLHFHDNVHIGGICHHMIETDGLVDVIEHSNIFKPEYSFKVNDQKTLVYRHSNTGNSKIIHGSSIAGNVAGGGYVTGAADIVEFANIQNFRIGGADLYGINNHVISSNIVTGLTTQYVYRYYGGTRNFTLNGNIYKDWQDVVYLGSEVSATNLVGALTGNLTDGVSRNLVSEFGTGLTGKIGYAGNYSSNYTSGGKSAVLGQTLPNPVITAGGGIALPTTPLGYLNVSVNGVASYIPYYR